MLHDPMSHSKATLVDTYVPNPLVISVGQEGTTVLLHAGTGQYYSLNPTGTDVWQALCDLQSLESTIERLAKRFDIPADRIQHDLLELVEALLAHELLTRDVA